MWFFILAIMTKTIDIYLVLIGPDPLVNVFPLFSCDIGLIMAIVMLVLHMKNPEKDYYTVDRFIVYMVLFNSLVPFVTAFDFTPERFEIAWEHITSYVKEMYYFDNSIVHGLYLLISLLYAKYTNLFNRSTKGFWKCLVIYAGITLVVHIINLIFDAAGVEAQYMYTLNATDSYSKILEGIFGRGVGRTITELTELPIIGCYFGALFIYYFGITMVYLIHRLIYKQNKKMGLDNLFYNKLIYPNDTIV